jgi:hypothetical protein
MEHAELRLGLPDRRRLALTRRRRCHPVSSFCTSDTPPWLFPPLLTQAASCGLLRYIAVVIAISSVVVATMIWKYTLQENIGKEKSKVCKKHREREMKSLQACNQVT